MSQELHHHRVFVSIAAYRDPQLNATIADCLKKAQRPLLLRFGICWQHAAEDLPPAYAGDDRFQVLNILWQDSRGACWARAEAMKFVAGRGMVFAGGLALPFRCRLG
jgi:Glycosyltransferase (GlcNAc)